MYDDVPQFKSHPMLGHGLFLRSTMYISHTTIRIEYSSSILNPVGLDRRTHDDTHFIARTLPASSVSEPVAFCRSLEWRLRETPDCQIIMMAKKPQPKATLPLVIHIRQRFFIRLYSVSKSRSARTTLPGYPVWTSWSGDNPHYVATDRSRFLLGKSLFFFGNRGEWGSERMRSLLINCAGPQDVLRKA